MRNTNTQKILKSIESELVSLIHSEQMKITNPSYKNPIIIENDLGTFKYVGNKNLFITPKKGVEYLVLNIEIKPSSSEL